MTPTVPAPSPASPSTARAVNDRLALRLLQDQGPLTAAQLKTLTGLSRPSVADLVDRLAAAGMIKVVGESGVQRRGPNARLYGIVARRAFLAALDVRTDSATAVVTDLVGQPLTRTPLPVDAPEAAVAELRRAAREVGAAELHTVAVGAPGLVSPATGELRDTSGLPAWHRELVAALQRELPARILVENETNLAAVAEQRCGVARNLDSFVLLWLGAGVSATVVLDGRLRRGASGGAGEIGFLPVPGTAGLPSATDCGGGFHALAGREAVASLAAEHGFAGPVEEAVAGAAGEAFLEALAERLALGAAAVAAVLDPGCVVLGGELGLAGGPALAARVATRLSALTPVPTEVRATTLGGDAVLEGARLSARDAAREALLGGR
ncbi:MULTISPECIES: ROK family transcriptional regulator [unclassified Streptomyces]|uniref:ROK family transcriptional regulator n=1 Tax=unclassified Streptomyces TaxID=2593676 RepID=UPI001BEADAC4|nr:MULTISPECIES: ROK family transcriptional regulator [unclassified Streptomyces]MBT2408140.1 ROK family transcriptional regulator [Streptomyces sp. ISL-21]MBT2609301.1 ROK family transcriptional regulator [Streptomyces sp. ISL-87]